MRVVFPLPLAPTIAVTLPLGMERLMFERISLGLYMSYLKERSLMAIECPSSVPSV